MIVLEISLCMWALYIVGIQYKRTSWWGKCLYPITYPVAVVAGLLDIALNYTLFAVMTWDYPQGTHEVTFSKRLKRLVKEANWRGVVARFIARYMLNPFDPKGPHVPI